jgi:hypothetical protein
MAREGQERRTKHRQDVGGASSRAPAARNKQLAKRRRPISYQEESYPEASPPRGGPPESPNEVECLKIEAPSNSHQLGYCELQQGGTNDPDESPKPALLQLSQGKRHR